MITIEQAKEKGVELSYVNTASMENPIEELMAMTEGHGYDDVFVYVPNKQVAEMGDKLLAFDGCMNFFAGPTDNQFMVTHVGGIDSIIDATLNLPKIPGGKKLTYTMFDMPLTAIDDFAELGKTDPLFAKLDEACKRNRGMWSAEAERILFDHFGVKPEEV